MEKKLGILTVILCCLLGVSELISDYGLRQDVKFVICCILVPVIIIPEIKKKQK